MAEHEYQDPMVNVRLELVIERVRLLMMQHMQDYTGEMNKMIELALTNAFNPHTVNELIRKEIEQQIIYIIRECTKEAIQQNWELKQTLVKAFKGMIVEGVKEQLDRGVYGE